MTNLFLTSCLALAVGAAASADMTSIDMSYDDTNDATTAPATAASANDGYSEVYAGGGVECDPCNMRDECGPGLGCEKGLCVWSDEVEKTLELCAAAGSAPTEKSALSEVKIENFGEECEACNEGDGPKGCGQGLICSSHLCVWEHKVEETLLTCRGGSSQCKVEGKRCIGEEGSPTVEYGDGCCDPLMCTKKDDSPGGYGLLCEYFHPPAAPKVCYDNGERCRGDEGGDYVPWLNGCCRGSCTKTDYSEDGFGFLCEAFGGGDGGGNGDGGGSAAPSYYTPYVSAPMGSTAGQTYESAPSQAPSATPSYQALDEIPHEDTSVTAAPSYSAPASPAAPFYTEAVEKVYSTYTAPEGTAATEGLGKCSPCSIEGEEAGCGSGLICSSATCVWAHEIEKTLEICNPSAPTTAAPSYFEAPTEASTFTKAVEEVHSTYSAPAPSTEVIAAGGVRCNSCSEGATGADACADGLTCYSGKCVWIGKEEKTLLICNPARATEAPAYTEAPAPTTAQALVHTGVSVDGPQNEEKEVYKIVDTATPATAAPHEVVDEDSHETVETTESPSVTESVVKSYDAEEFEDEGTTPLSVDGEHYPSDPPTTEAPSNYESGSEDSD